MSGRGRHRRDLGPYRWLQDRFRRRRMDALAARFPLGEATRVLDVGGHPRTWSYLDARPQVTILNLGVRPREEGRFRFLPGDGRRLDFPDGAFDLAFSNSVIEHVGAREDQRAFAQELARVGRSYYLQTPNRAFLLEPHVLAPGFQFLPRPWRLRLVRNFTPVGWLRRPGPAEVEALASIELLGRRDLEEFLPGARLEAERFLGFAKSWIAWGGAIAGASP